MAGKSQIGVENQTGVKGPQSGAQPPAFSPGGEQKQRYKFVDVIVSPMARIVQVDIFKEDSIETRIMPYDLIVAKYQNESIVYIVIISNNKREIYHNIRHFHDLDSAAYRFLSYSCGEE